MITMIKQSVRSVNPVKEDFREFLRQFWWKNSSTEQFTFSNLVELLSARAKFQGEKTAFVFLDDGETETSRISYQQLDLQARRIATYLQSLNMKGERALLLYQSGAEFIPAFFGCLYAGVIAVPVYPPRKTLHLSRLQDIIADAQAKIALTNSSNLQKIHRHCEHTPQLAHFQWLDLEKELISVNAEQWEKPPIDKDDIAFLQYTSGSTGKPKGVMVTHHNLLVNSRAMKLTYDHDSDSVIVTWLPLFHDMGLIWGMLQPIYSGCLGVMMPPTAFLQKPLRWLKAIEKYHGTHTAAPNFAYELCCRKISLEQRTKLNLSSLITAGSGSETIRKETIEKFSDYFAVSGFNSQAFSPSYGLAEATLFVTGVASQELMSYHYLDSSSLRQNQVKSSQNYSSAKTLVGCGHTELDTEIIIVNPQTLYECKTNEIGEIWVKGQTVTKGYWNNPEKTQEVFQAYTKASNKGPFLRTGDLGFIQNGELIVTGRLKDIIIIRGKNHYPQDIEMTVEKSHQALITNYCAAFSIDVLGEEKLFVVAEIDRNLRIKRKSLSNEEDDFQSKKSLFAEITRNIRQSVTQHHGLEVYGVGLLRYGTILKTSSGKIKRQACRDHFLEGKLNIIYNDIKNKLPVV